MGQQHRVHAEAEPVPALDDAQALQLEVVDALIFL